MFVIQQVPGKHNISITLKGVSGRTFDEAKGMLRRIIGNEAMRFQFLMQSSSLTETERKCYESLITIDKTGAFTMSDELLKDSLKMLSQLLCKHYGQEVVILIDEYDVPLDKAYQSGYYDDMVELIRILFGNAVKTNDSLNFAILTGYLRISKESNVSASAETSEKRSTRFSQTSPKGDVLFTGLNNFNVYTVKDVQYNEYFGFTDVEVRKMLESFCRAFEENNTDVIEKSFTAYLRKTISIRDANVKKEMKENFYHEILLGLFAGMKGWKVKSNAESGDGYSDISIEVDDKEIGIIIELKYAEKADFDRGCSEALKQINDRNYEEALIDDGMTMIRKYGIACYKKRCRVISS